MKNLMLVVLVGVFGLSVPSVFAQTIPQTRPETIKEKIIRLELENAALKAQVDSLIKVQAQLQENESQADLPKELKPYYATAQIQQLCEKFDAIEGKGRDQNVSIDKYMQNQYKRQGKTVENAEMSISSVPSGVLTGSKSRTVYKITLTIMNRNKKIARIKVYEKWIYNN